MSEKQPHKRKTLPPAAGDSRFLVYGLNVVVHMGGEELAPFAVQCPQGQPILYGQVVARGDGFDPEAGQLRPMPPIGAVIAFEESTDGVEGHYFFDGDNEYRILHLDALHIAFQSDAEE